MVIGISFCHVDKTKQIFQDNEDIIFGNQKWNGAIPSLIIILDIRIVEEIIKILGIL